MVSDYVNDGSKDGTKELLEKVSSTQHVRVLASQTE